MNLGETTPPKELIIKDYTSLLNKVKLRMGSKYKKLLLMQSIIGHAQNGHAEFSDKAYVNTTLDDIVDALASSKNLGLVSISKDDVKASRDEVIEMLKSPFKRIIKGEDITGLTDEEGKPLLGISTLRKAKIRNKEAFLTGGYLASKMDSYEWRKKLADDKKYNLEMGGGECVAVNMEELAEYNLTLKDIADSEFGKALKLFKEAGVIIEREKIKSTDNIKNAFIRHKIGRGVSDDAAIITAGMLYGEEAFWGAYLLDAIDTWDKYATYIIKGGADESFGEELKNYVKVTDDEVLRFIYLSRMEKKYPDSSQRYFLEVDKDINQTALESHLKFLRGESFEEMGIGYRKKGERRLKNTTFYRKLKQRLKN